MPFSTLEEVPPALVSTDLKESSTMVSKGSAKRKRKGIPKILVLKFSCQATYIRDHIEKLLTCVDVLLDRTMSSLMSSCLSRTAWRAQCKTTHPVAAPHFQVIMAWPPPAVLAAARRPHTSRIPVCQLPGYEACRSSAPYTSSAVSSPHSQQGTAEGPTCYQPNKCWHCFATLSSRGESSLIAVRTKSKFCLQLEMFAVYKSEMKLNSDIFKCRL